MSKKNKIVYSDVQPNAKEAGVWVNTTDGNVKIEKDGKWVDDAGSGSGDSGGEASTIEYLDLRNYSGTAFGVAVNAKSLLFKFNSNLFNGDSESAPVYQIYVVGDVLEAEKAYIQALLMGSDFVGIDFNLKTNGKGELKTTAQQIIEDQGITQEQLDAIPRISKEEFYSLE